MLKGRTTGDLAGAYRADYIGVRSAGRSPLAADRRFRETANGHWPPVSGHRSAVRGQWQPDLEGAAAAGLALDADVAAVGADVGADDAEAEAEAAFGAAAVATVETIPDPRLLLCRDAGAGVRHRDEHVLGVAPGPDRKRCHHRHVIKYVRG